MNNQDFSTLSLEYIRTEDALIALRTLGKVEDELEDTFIDRLENIWFLMTTEERDKVEQHYKVSEKDGQ